MADAIAHRGPDEEGFYVDDHAALGHRRLSIIDLSSGQQPMAAQNGNYQIVFNGEVYNYLEIKEDLIQKGYHFKTTSDTEVVLKSYIEWGESCVKKFNGMFAFAIWDKKQKRLFASRDRVGKKPFYYTWDGKTFAFAFASEIKSLLIGRFSNKKIDPKALDCYLTFGYIPVPFSIFDDIHKLAASQTLIVQDNQLNKSTYWQVNFDIPIVRTMEEACEEFKSLLYDAVKCRLMSEVPLGAFLSSGLDSTLVVSFMSEIMTQKVLTNTIGFGDPKFSEMPAARQVADHLGTNHHEFIVDPNASETIQKIAAILTNLLEIQVPYPPGMSAKWLGRM